MRADCTRRRALRAQGAYGDSRQEIVFIGVEPMDEAAIRRALDGCLLGSEEELDAFQRAWEAAVTPKAPEPPKPWWKPF